LVLVQNNIEAANAVLEIENMKSGRFQMTVERLLDMAWEYYINYLIWKDSQI